MFEDQDYITWEEGSYLKDKNIINRFIVTNKPKFIKECRCLRGKIFMNNKKKIRKIGKKVTLNIMN